MTRLVTHLLAISVGWWAARACRWWADHTPSHNCEELP